MQKLNLDQVEESKYFVDMKLKYPEQKTLEDFNTLTDKEKYDRDFMSKWLDDYFDPPGSEFQNHQFEQVEHPKMLEKIENHDYRQWALELHRIWQQLGRDTSIDVKMNSELYSFIPIDDVAIVPTGFDGRFRETYYWDSYWMIKGMLHSEMYEPVLGVLRNFKQLISDFGFIPNGTRKYYSKRSQPPFFGPMVREWYDVCKDLKNNDCDEIMKNEFIPALEMEFEFWESDRTIKINSTHKMNHYASKVNTNRPEAYLQDEEVLQTMPDDDSRKTLAAHITSAAESGWDFSYRWTGKNYTGTEEEVLSSMITTNIIPVDLNSLVAELARLLSDFHGMLGDAKKSIEYKSLWEQKTALIEEILYDKDSKSYFDFNLESGKLNKNYFASNYVPLYFYSKSGFPSNVNPEKRKSELLSSLRKQDVLDFPYGIPNSLGETGQQWDFPNSWPPSVHMIIVGLLQCGGNEMIEGRNQAQKWLNVNYNAYKEYGQMFEKMNVISGSPGAGGEYPIQTGFGWSNGVILDILMLVPDIGPTPSSCRSITSAIWLLSLMFII